MAIVEPPPLTIPKWAERITVVQDGETLIVHGEGRISVPVHPDALRPGQDLLREYTDYAKHWGQKRSGKSPPHIQFSNCGTDTELIGFLRRFGPVSASPLTFHERRKTVTAVQPIDGLRRDRAIFSGATRLVAQFGGGNQGEISRLAEGLVEIAEGATMPGPRLQRQTIPEFSENPWYGTKIFPLFGQIAREQRWVDPNVSVVCCIRALQAEKARKYARVALCVLFNHFAPLLVPAGNRIIELPRHEPGSVLPALYFMLRQDYLRGHEITICAQRDCGAFFVVERSGQRFCSAYCSRLERQRQYWKTDGSAQRRERRSRLSATRKGR